VSEGQATQRQATTVAGSRSALRRMIAVPVLILVNVAVFVLTAVQAKSIANNVAADAFQKGALVPALVDVGDWWRLVTSGFLHFGSLGGYGPVHLIFNMFALYVLGRDLEPLLGWARFTAVYGLALLGGSAAVMLFSDPYTTTAGASGAIYGLFGGIAVVAYRLKLSLGPVIGLLVVNLVLSFALPGISLAAHLGGLVAGAITTAGIVYAPRERRNLIQGAVVALVFVVIVAVILVRIGTLDCTGLAFDNAFCVR
jgi:membrane associated rhomboid family serine protease